MIDALSLVTVPACSVSSNQAWPIRNLLTNDKCSVLTYCGLSDSVFKAYNLRTVNRGLWTKSVEKSQCAALWLWLVMSSCLWLQWEWGWFPGRPPKLCPSLPSHPVSVATKTDHEPVEDRASIAEDKQTDDLHRWQTAMVQCHWDHLQRGLCYWWGIRQLPSISFHLYVAASARQIYGLLLSDIGLLQIDQNQR